MHRSVVIHRVSSLVILIIILLVRTPPDVSNAAQGRLTPTPYKSLSEQLGFSDPVIEELQQKGIREVSEDTVFTAYNRTYRLLSFLPIRVPTGDGMRIDFGTVLLFQLDGDEVNLVWRNDVGSQSPLLTKSESGSWPSPGDWQQNGTIRFGVFYAQDNTCPSSRIYDYVLNPDGTVTSLFKTVIPAGHIVTSVEKTEDGILRLILDDQRGLFSSLSASTCTGPRMHRYFELKGTQLVDVSAQYKDLYFEKLGQNLTALTTWQRAKFDYMGQENASVLYSARLMEVLLIYEALNQRQAGYTLVNYLGNQALQTGLINNGSYLDKDFLPAISWLYQQDQPFIPPDYIGPNAQQPINFYQ